MSVLRKLSLVQMRLPTAIGLLLLAVISASPLYAVVEFCDASSCCESCDAECAISASSSVPAAPALPLQVVAAPNEAPHIISSPVPVASLDPPPAVYISHAPLHLLNSTFRI